MNLAFMAGQYGVENLIKLIDLGTDTAEQVGEVLADGKFQWTESFKFIDEFAQIPGVVKAWPEIKKEAGELDEEDRLVLHAHVKQKFDIPNEEIESFIEDALLNALTTISLVERLRKLKKK